MVKFFRSQEELLERICHRLDATTDPALVLEEIGEYMKQAKFVPLALRELFEDVVEDNETQHNEGRECTCVNVWLHPEDNLTITDTAYRVLPLLDAAARRSQPARFARIAAQFRAWKWLLGHANADILFDRTHDRDHLVQALSHELIGSNLWSKFAGGDYQKRKNQQAIRERIRNEALNQTSVVTQAA